MNWKIKNLTLIEQNDQGLGNFLRILILLKRFHLKTNADFLWPWSTARGSKTLVKLGIWKSHRRPHEAIKSSLILNLKFSDFTWGKTLEFTMRKSPNELLSIRLKTTTQVCILKRHYIAINTFLFWQNDRKYQILIDFRLVSPTGVVCQWTSPKVKSKKASINNLLSSWDAFTISNNWWMFWGTCGSITNHWADDLANSTW